MNKGILRMKALLEHLACIAAGGALLLGNLRTSPGYAKIARPPDPSLP